MCYVHRSREVKGYVSHPNYMRLEDTEARCFTWQQKSMNSSLSYGLAFLLSEMFAAIVTSEEIFRFASTHVAVSQTHMSSQDTSDLRSSSHKITSGIFSE